MVKVKSMKKEKGTVGKVVVCAFVLVILVLVFAGVMPVAAATTWSVDDSGGANFITIQAAVDAANEGDTIIVKSGTYYENVNVTKQLILRGMDTGGGKPVVDAGGSGSAITLSADGIMLEGFTATNAGSPWTDVGIKVTSNNNNITDNNASNSGGIYLRYSSNNTITGNNASNNNNYGISLFYSSSNNTITGNNASNNNGNGIYLFSSSNNNITGNSVNSNNGYGIHPYYSSNNIVTGNTFVNDGLFVTYSYQNTVEDNIVNGKPLVYLEDKSDIEVTDAGQVILVNCNNITVENLDLSNISVGIELWRTENSILSNNNIINNGYGIYLFSSSNNKIYLNNFINNNVYSYNSNNFWNSTEKITYTYNGNTYTNYLGNYWDDYKGNDTNKDGIGDTPYPIDSDNDNYPLMEPFENYFALAESPWPMFQHDPQHTGRSAYPGPQTSNVKWEFEFGDSLYSAVVGQGGVVYAGSEAGLYAISPNGELQWSYSAPALRRVPGIAPDGAIYILWQEGVSALTPTGDLRWFYDLDESGLSANPVVRTDGSLVVSTVHLLPDESKHVVLLAFDSDGTLLWMFDSGYELPPNSAVKSSPVVDHDGDIYFGAGTTLFALDSGGNLKWNKTLGGTTVGTPAVGSDGTGYIVTSGGLSDAEGIYAVSPNGTILWKYWQWGYGGSDCSPALSADGTVYFAVSHAYFGMGHGFLEALDPFGNLKWEVRLASQPFVYYSSPIVGDDGTIYIVGSVNSVRALNPNGTIKWSAGYANVHAHSTSLSLGPDGTLYLVGNQKLYAIGPAPENQLPVADAGTDQSASSGDLVWFDGSNSYDPDLEGTIVSYGWDFGDGETATGCNVSHRFRGAMGNSKDYTVKLTVEDDKGATASDTVSVTVYSLKRYIPVYSSLSHLLPPPPPKIMEVTIYYNWINETEEQDEYIVSEVHLDSVEDLNFALYMFSIKDDGQVIWKKIHKDAGKVDVSFVYPFNVPQDCTKTIGDEHFKGLAVGPNSNLNFLVYGVELGLSGGPSFFRVSRTIELGPGKQTEVPSIYPIKTAGILVTRGSPVELHIYDSTGNVTGLVNGEVKEEIPNSLYDNESETVIIFSPSDSYRYEVVGTDEGIYGLSITSVESGEATNFTATDIPISPNAIHQYTIDWDALSQGEEGATVQVDSNGDGVFEQTFTADDELSREEFLSATNVPPIADANGPYIGVVDSPIAFDGTGSYDQDGTIVSYEWDLDDDGEFDDATGPTPTKTWDAPYSGNICLRVTDNDGATGIDSTTLTVEIPANVIIKPETLNLKSKGHFTAFITLPEPYNITDINISTVACEEAPAVKGMAAGDNKYIAKFDRGDLREDLPTGDEVEMRVIGKVFYNGGYVDFEGCDTIRVIDKGKGGK